MHIAKAVLIILFFLVIAIKSDPGVAMLMTASEYAAYGFGKQIGQAANQLFQVGQVQNDMSAKINASRMAYWKCNEICDDHTQRTQQFVSYLYQKDVYFLYNEVYMQGALSAVGTLSGAAPLDGGIRSSCRRTFNAWTRAVAAQYSPADLKADAAGFYKSMLTGRGVSKSHIQKKFQQAIDNAVDLYKPYVQCRDKWEYDARPVSAHSATLKAGQVKQENPVKFKTGSVKAQNVPSPKADFSMPHPLYFGAVYAALSPDGRNALDPLLKKIQATDQFERQETKEKIEAEIDSISKTTDLTQSIWIFGFVELGKYDFEQNSFFISSIWAFDPHSTSSNTLRVPKLKLSVAKENFQSIRVEPELAKLMAKSDNRGKYAFRAKVKPLRSRYQSYSGYLDVKVLQIDLLRGQSHVAIRKAHLADDQEVLLRYTP